MTGVLNQESPSDISLEIIKYATHPLARIMSDAFMTKELQLNLWGCSMRINHGVNYITYTKKTEATLCSFVCYTFIYND